MGSKTMVSSNQDQTPHDPAHQCQGSVYRLALDEMQSHLSDMGKPLYTMKSEKLLSIEPSMEQQQNHVQSSYATSSGKDSPTLHGNPSVVNGSLCRQGMQAAVWHEVSQRSEQGDSRGAFDTTLEDFLARATAVNYEGQGDVVVMDPQPFMAEVLDPIVQQRAELLHYQLAATHQTQQQKKMSVFDTSIPMFNDAVLGDYIESKQRGTSILPVVPMTMRSTLADTHATGMQEVKQSDGPLDKNYERKQKRMIKNRESAARSRAKKQAYINQLEKEVDELKRANECLKRKNGMHVGDDTRPASFHHIFSQCIGASASEDHRSDGYDLVNNKLSQMEARICPGLLHPPARITADSTALMESDDGEKLARGGTESTSPKRLLQDGQFPQVMVEGECSGAKITAQGDIRRSTRMRKPSSKGKGGSKESNPCGRFSDAHSHHS